MENKNIYNLLMIINIKCFFEDNDIIWINKLNEVIK